MHLRVCSAVVDCSATTSVSAHKRAYYAVSFKRTSSTVPVLVVECVRLFDNREGLVDKRAVRLHGWGYRERVHHMKRYGEGVPLHR